MQLPKQLPLHNRWNINRLPLHNLLLQNCSKDLPAVARSGDLAANPDALNDEDGEGRLPIYNAVRIIICPIGGLPNDRR